MHIVHRSTIIIVALIGIALLFVAECAAAGPVRKPLLGYTTEFAQESPEQTAWRHAVVQQRREAPIVIVHRGAWYVAPQNTLEAYAAAMDLGADGFEIDIRITADGVLVAFHDPMLHQWLHGFGFITEVNYYEMLSMTPRLRYGRFNRLTHVPTLVAAFEVARQRGALLMLDIKVPDIDAEIAALIDEADMWDHIVMVSDYNSDYIKTRPELNEVTWKSAEPYRTGGDVDPEAMAAYLALPGDAVLVDDPRTASLVLGRDRWDPVPLPIGLRRFWPPSFAPLPDDPADYSPMQSIRALAREINPNSTDDLIEVLDNADLNERFNEEGDDEYLHARLLRLNQRAWAADQLGRLGRKKPEIVAALLRQVEGRTLINDWRYRALDERMAVRALARLNAVEAVPMLIDWHDRVHPELYDFVDSSYPNPVEWFDHAARREIVQAMGWFRTPMAKQWLWEYVQKTPEEVYPLTIGFWKEAAASLLMRRPSVKQQRTLLTSENDLTRAESILGCRDRNVRGARWALRAEQPWALMMPPARGRPLYR